MPAEDSLNYFAELIINHRYKGDDNLIHVLLSLQLDSIFKHTLNG